MKNRFFRGFLAFCFLTLSLSALSVGISVKATQSPDAGESSDDGESFRTLTDYTDGAHIQSRYREAVAVISAIKVMDGYKDVNSQGRVSYSFRPQGTLTRGAGTKIVANLAITPEDGGWYKKLVQKNQFTDVSKEHVFSSHIFYCAQQNLISGDENHCFNPGEPLTYNAFLKMLLCVLGHDQYGEGYTGQGWQQRVQSDALNNGLLHGLPEDFANSLDSHGGEAIPREVAALFAFNALLANQVDYSNEVPIPRIVDLNASGYATIRDAKALDASGKAVSQLVQFGEERFPDLRRDVTPAASENGGEIVTVTWSYFVKGEDGNKTRQTICRYAYVTPFQNYTVSFDRNDGSGASSIEPKRVTNGGVYGELPAPKRDGFGFAGWFTSLYGGERMTSFSPVWLSGDITLYAHWTQGKYYAYFNGNGGSVSRDSMEIPASGVLRTLPTPVREGYFFRGWYTDAEEGEQVQSGDKVDVSSSVTLYAHWRPRQYQVTFSAAGVVVSPSRKTVRQGEKYGDLPELQARDGDAFSGWYTAPDGNGRKIEETTPVNLSDNQTLYAYWGYETNDAICTLTFSVNGLTHTTRRIEKGERLTEWPDPPQTENDFEFTGWVESVKGKVPALPLTVNSDMLFQASYNELKSHTVIFRADGVAASALPAPVTLNPGEQLQELPGLKLPANDARRFLGWAYNDAPVSIPLTVREDMELYALWAEPLSYKDFSYGFANNTEGFQYSAGVDARTFKPRYGLIFGEDTALAKQIYEYDVKQNGYEWHGNCYGMSTTAGMFQYQGNGLSIADFAEPERGLKNLWEITSPKDESLQPVWDNVTRKNITLLEFIEAMQISQKTTAFLKTYWENVGSLNRLCEEVARVSETNGGAVVICIYNREDKGHALLGYYLEERDNRTSRIRVYDSNYPYDSDYPDRMHYLILTRDNDGNYTNWYYDDARERADAIVEEMEGALMRWSSGNGGKITFIPYEKYYQIWRRRGNQDVSMNLLTTTLTDAVIYDGDGRRLATFRNGEIENPDDIRRNGIYPLVNLDENPSAASRTVAVWLPDSNEYRVQNIGADSEKQTVTLSNTERSVSVTTKARLVTLSVDKDKTPEANPSQGKKAAQKEFILRAAAEGADDALQIRAEGVSLPPRVDAPPSPDKSVTWYGSTRSQMELTLNLLYDGTIHSVECVGDGETNELSVNGENMTGRLKNAPDGVIRFEDVYDAFG